MEETFNRRDCALKLLVNRFTVLQTYNCKNIPKKKNTCHKHNSVTISLEQGNEETQEDTSTETFIKQNEGIQPLELRDDI